MPVGTLYPIPQPLIPAGGSSRWFLPAVAGTGGVLNLAVTTDLEGSAFGIDLGIAHQYQRGGFTHAGRDWLFFTKNSASVPALHVTSSTDSGATWSTPTLIRSFTDWGVDASNGYSDVHFDGTYVHYAVGGGGAPAPFVYRRGTPNSDGSITWSAAEQTVDSGIDAPLELGLSTDSNGVPYISYEFFGFGTGSEPTPWITKATAADGTWTTDTANGFPFQLTSERSHWWTDVLRLDQFGAMIAFYWHDGFDSSSPFIRAQIWDGGSWSGEFQIDSPTGKGDTDGLGIVSNVAVATNPALGEAYALWGDTSTSKVMINEYTGSSWSASTQINTVGATTCSIGVKSDTGEVYAVYLASGSDTSVKYQVRTGGVWAAANELFAVADPVRRSALQITDYEDRVQVACQTNNTGADKIYVFSFGTAAAGTISTTGVLTLALAASGATAKVATGAGSIALTVTPSDGDSKIGQATGAVSTALSASGAATKIADALGSVALALGLNGTVTSTRDATGAMTLTFGTTGADVKTGAMTGSISLTTLLQSVAAKDVSAAAALALAFTLAGDAAKAGDVAGSLGVTLGLSGSAAAVAGGNVTGAMALALAIAAVAEKVATVSGSVQLALTASGAVVKTGSVAGPITLSTGLSAAAVKSASTVAALSLLLGLSGADEELGAPDAPAITFPTTVDIGVWLAQVLVTPNLLTVEMVARVTEVLVESANATEVVVDSNLGAVDITPNPKTVVITPNVATVEVG